MFFTNLTELSFGFVRFPIPPFLCVVSFLVHHLIWQDSQTPIPLEGAKVLLSKRNAKFIWNFPNDGKNNTVYT